MRIKIRDDKKREYFFNTVKEKAGKSWKEIRNEYLIPRSTFDKYRLGDILIPEKLFLSLVNSFDESNKREIYKFIEKLPNNFGNILGGKEAYKINFKKFQEGRQKGALAIRRKRNAENISFEGIQLSPQICEFMGAFIGDGCFNSYKNNLYQIEFAGDKRYDIPYYNDIIVPIVKSIIPEIKPHIYDVNSRENTIRVVFYSKKLFLFLRDFCEFVPGKKTFTISIPKKIIDSSDKNFIYSTIRGIFDTDGGVFLDKRSGYKSPYPRIFIQTVSKSLYDQLYGLLSKEFDMYPRFNEKRQIYIIEIYGINQVKKWMSLIGFSNRRHLNKIASVAQW